jgi:hypothetical protein
VLTGVLAEYQALARPEAGRIDQDPNGSHHRRDIYRRVGVRLATRSDAGWGIRSAEGVSEREELKLLGMTASSACHPRATSGGQARYPKDNHGH